MSNGEEELIKYFTDESRKIRVRMNIKYGTERFYDSWLVQEMFSYHLN